jgi:hypothetical protein
MNKKILSLILVGSIIGVLLTGCEDVNSVDKQQAKQQEQMLQELNNQVGLPEIKEWSEKKMMKEILELRDNSKLVTYAYTRNEMTGKYIYFGQCIGFGLPYATQYTNPERIASSLSQGGYAILPQADPNGLFMPSSAEATWLQYINPDTGKREITYIEERVTVTQSKLPRRLCDESTLPKDYDIK